MLKIVSGGQIGVDRGALDAALELGISCGGWCPAGRFAEDGIIPERYPVVELPTASYSERTARNVADSDGTLVISNGPLIGGTRETLELCLAKSKPHLVIDCASMRVEEASAGAAEFVKSLSFRVAQTMPVRLGPRNHASVRKSHEKLRGPSPRKLSGLGMTIVLNVAGPRASQWPEGRKIAQHIVSAVLRQLSGQETSDE